MLHKTQVRNGKNGQSSFIKGLQVQLLNRCNCQGRKGAQLENSSLDYTLSMPFFDAIR